MARKPRSKKTTARLKQPKLSERLETIGGKQGYSLFLELPAAERNKKTCAQAAYAWLGLSDHSPPEVASCPEGTSVDVAPLLRLCFKHPNLTVAFRRGGRTIQTAVRSGMMRDLGPVRLWHERRRGFIGFDDLLKLIIAPNGKNITKITTTPTTASSNGKKFATSHQMSASSSTLCVRKGSWTRGGVAAARAWTARTTNGSRNSGTLVP
ncbi:hypothetical protein BKA63DRAFT_486297 [Paraphoma chrysanthemicola]|nr:hypothetical protein BKA63DRAFT_486297 [Paraphoma chrysanthemicola]